MKYFLDTEFHDHHGDELPELISLGVVAEDGREFYAENLNYDVRKASHWLRENVIANFTGPGLPENILMQRFIDFTNVRSQKFTETKFICWYGTYDWFLLRMLMDRHGIQRPKHWPWNFVELQFLHETFFRMFDTRQVKHRGAAHNALTDAWWNKELFEIVEEEAAKKGVKL